MRTQWRLSFPNDPDGNAVQPYRRWTGAGTLSIKDPADQTKTLSFESGGILDIGSIDLGTSLAGATGITLDAVKPEDRKLFLSFDPGPAPCRIIELWRKRDKGGSWPTWQVEEAYEGKLSTPQYEGGRIVIEIQQVFDDVWRGIPLRWTGTDQRRRFEGDSGLDRADRIRRSGLVVATT